MRQPFWTENTQRMALRTGRIDMKKQEMINRLLEPMEKAFDEKENMIVRDYEHWVGGYHTRRTGRTHVVRDTADYAASVLILEQKEHYEKAVRALYRICELQDLRPGSRTYGLWSYYLEEDLDHMLAPDYNWSDFIGKNLIGILSMCRNRLPEDLQKKLRESIRAAMECSIKRNVAADYTNMSIMGCMTITAAGDLLGDGKLFRIGRERLEKLYEYTAFNGAFSEYNSSAYILVAMNEIMRMLAFFRDERCLFIAEELNRYAWECLASHYNTSIGQLTPPQARAYRDLDNGSLAWAVWQGTGGRFGRVPEEEEAVSGGISLESLCFPPKCPQECLRLFEEKKRFLAHTYYRKNDIRSQGEDTTIIRELDSPDLTAFSYVTGRYSMGAFALCDCWAQRRNVMVVWDKEKPKYFRLRCINGDYDFCSGLAVCSQEKNVILGHLGLVTDRGSFHYILDREKDGRYLTKALTFKFELGGWTERLRIEKADGEDEWVIRDRELTISLRIPAWFCDGKSCEPYLAEDGRALILPVYEGEEKLLDTTVLGETYGVFRLAAESGDPEEIRLEQASEVITAAAAKGLVSSVCGGLKVSSHTCPVPYREALEQLF